MASADKAEQIVLLTSGVNIAAPAPFSGRCRRMVKLGLLIDDDDESVGDDDDLPPLEEVEGNCGRHSEDAGGRLNLVGHSCTENCDRTVFKVCDAL